jgi:hypothetical protein
LDISVKESWREIPIPTIKPNHIFNQTITSFLLSTFRMIIPLITISLVLDKFHVNRPKRIKIQTFLHSKSKLHHIFYRPGQNLHISECRQHHPSNNLIGIMQLNFVVGCRVSMGELQEVVVLFVLELFTLLHELIVVDTLLGDRLLQVLQGQHILYCVLEGFYLSFVAALLVVVIFLVL